MGREAWAGGRHILAVRLRESPKLWAEDRCGSPGCLPPPDHAEREKRVGLVQPSGPGHRTDPEARQQRKSTGSGWTGVGGRESW